MVSEANIKGVEIDGPSNSGDMMVVTNYKIANVFDSLEWDPTIEIDLIIIYTYIAIAQNKGHITIISDDLRFHTALSCIAF